MGIHTLSWLIDGDENVLQYYSNAIELWDQIFEQVGTDDLEKLAYKISSKQMLFEQNCGGRFSGQEVMVYTGLGKYYDTRKGFGNRRNEAQKVFLAIMHSSCSVEVKWHASEAAKSLNLYPLK